MKKIFSFLTLLLLTCSMAWADTEIFSYTVVNPAKGSYTATGGTAECTKEMASGGSNEITISEQTYYKFNSSSAWTFTLSSGTFAAGDVISFRCACGSSAKTGKGIQIQTSPTIAVTGDFPASTANTISYTVVANDGIAGESAFSIKRNDSDIKFGTVIVTRSAQYTVTYKANGGVGEDITDDAAIKVAANTFTYAGKAFTGWNTQADGKGTSYAVGASVSSDLILFAQWANAYTVIYDANGATSGSVPTDANSPYASGATVTVLGNTGSLEKIDYAFSCWNTQADGLGTDYNLGGTFNIAANTTLYAKWAVAYTVSYDKNGGTGTMDNTINEIVACTFDAPAGKMFYGWNTQADGNGTSYAVGDPVLGNLTLYAQWGKICGELIKAVHTGAKTADVTGVIGGTADKSTQDNGKLGNNGHYFGVKLTSGNFAAGDVVTIKASALNGGNTATLFSDKGEHSLGSAAFDAESKTASITLTESAEWIYLYRVSSACNPNVDYISVSRSCEESSDASIASLTINGDPVVAVAKVYSVELSSSYGDPTVTVEYTLGHPLATATPLSGFTINVPDAGAAANTQVITVTAEDNTQVEYTVSVSKSASLSNDATLKALSVDGYTLAPTFSSGEYAYTITKEYGADDPETSAVHATQNDDNAADPVISINENVFSIVVTAEDGETTQTYTITINTAAAPRAIKEIIMSNSYKAYIPAGYPDIYAYYLQGEDAPTIDSYKLDEGATLSVEGDQVTVTGADAGSDVYTIHIEEVAPIAFSAGEIVFDGSESYVKSGYGWDATKKWRFSKTDNDYSREIAGKTHVEMFLPACDTVILQEASVATRDIRVYVNGVKIGDIYSLEKNAKLAIPVGQGSAFMLTIESAQTSGDGGVGAIRMAKTPDAQIQLGANGWSTYATDYNFSVEGADVYMAAYDAVGNVVNLTKVEDAVVPSNTGIILKGNQDAYVTISRSYESVSNFSANQLQAAVAETPTPEHAYVLATEAGVTAFHPYEGVNIPAHKAYLLIGGTPAPVRIAFGENNATSVEELGASDEVQKFMQDGKLFIIRNGVVYDAMGKMVK